MKMLRLLAATAVLGAGCTALTPVPREEPPPAPREFRAAWVASVANIDWPSRKGLSSREQQAEIVAIVDRAAAIGLNALVLQVRPAADALYPSALEPWSEYLGGEQGVGPQPPYDPLQVWIEEAHRRGLELHAWFNPYRARHSSSQSNAVPSHISRTHPGVVKAYGDFLWMDPGEAFAAQRTLDVIMDVVRRYDVDGVHFDDYFYPYPISTGMPPSEVDFPDEPSWRTYVAGGGTLARSDWRRRNVDDLVRRIHEGVHREKAWVRFGISPFGIGRPDRRPPGIVGFSQYDKLYADAEKWLQEGWLDYLSPQLYWPIDQAAQAFAPLLDYWLAENTRSRHVWPGLFTSRIDDSAKSWKPEAIVDQVNLTRTRPAAGGHIHFSMKALMQDRKDIAKILAAGPYAVAALPPATPWLGSPALTQPPRVTAERTPNAVRVTVAPVANARLHAVWARWGTQWHFHVLAPSQPAIELLTHARGESLKAIVVSSVDRLGHESPRVHVDLP